MKLKLSLGQKAVCATLILAFVLTVTAVLVSYHVYSVTMDTHYQTLTMNVAKTAARVVDSGKVETYTKAVMDIYSQHPSPEFSDTQGKQEYLAQYDGIKDEGYWQLFKTMEKVKESNDVLSLYISYMDPKTMTGIYILDADTSEKACPTGTWESIFPENYEVMSHPEDGFPSYISNIEKFGWLCSAGAAVLNQDGQVVAHVFVDISMNRVMRDRYDYLIRLCLILLVATLALILLFIWVVNRALVCPVNRLASAAASYVSDKECAGKGQSSIEQLNIHTGDEVESLCGAIKQMECDINGYIENLTAVTAEKERIGAELDVAKHIQASMLPCIFPAFPDRTELDIYATMTPAKEVGGDFYDFFLVDDDRLAMVMADVSGKGVPAALFMVIAKTLLKNVAQTGLSPKAVLEKVNNQLCMNNEAEMFVTVWLGILEISTGRLTCANAGHEYLVLKRAGGDYALIKDKHGFVLAGMEGTRYKEYEIQMEPGDRMFLYTDGVAEATNAYNELYGTNRMLDALNRNKDTGCEILLCRMKEEIDTFVGEAPQFDDITMLGLELMPQNGPAMKKLKLTPTLESIEQVTAFVEQELEKAGIPLKVIVQMNIAVDEIFSNIARYSGADDATVGVTAKDGCITLRFADNGSPYDPTEKPDPNTSLSAEERNIGGLGIFMVKKSMDTVEYEYQDGFNILTLTKLSDSK